MIEPATLTLTESQQGALDKMPPRVAEALSHFCEALLARFGDQILRLILYGSFARGEAHAESDVDVMVVVGWEFERLPGGWYRSPYGDPRWEAIIDLSVEATLEGERYVSPLVLSEALFYDRSTEAAREARREGIDLYNLASGVTPAAKYLATRGTSADGTIPSAAPRVLKEAGPAPDYDTEPADLGDPRLWLALANDDLQVIRDLYRDGHFNQAISRAYYGIFYAAKASLLSVGVTVKTHTGINSEFGRCFVTTGRVEQQYQVMLSRAGEDRLRSDYAPKTRPVRESVERIIRDAEVFIAKARELVEEEMSRRGGALP
jgi:hypothetical protein